MPDTPIIAPPAPPGPTMEQRLDELRLRGAVMAFNARRLAEQAVRLRAEPGEIAAFEIARAQLAEVFGMRAPPEEAPVPASPGKGG